MAATTTGSGFSRTSTLNSVAMNMLAPYLRKTFCAPVPFAAPTPLFPSAFASLTMAISFSCGSNGERFTISTRLSEQEANTCVS